MSKVAFHKVTTLPGTLEPNAFYFVENANFCESYVTDDAGVAKSIGNSAMINALIAAALADWEVAANSVEIVADIAARDALVATLEVNAMILVVDASADPTVGSGSALYAYDATAEEIYKIAEYESMDVTLEWADINGRPTSTPAQIDSAVGQAHSHANKPVLDKLSEDVDGLLYDGDPVSSRWKTQAW